MPTFEDDSEYSMILVMGVTGSGKSYFINKLQAGAAVEGRNLRSETSECDIVRCKIGKHLVAVVDTPGFDDTDRTDAEILDEIVRFLVVQYELGIKLRGIIYLHRITDNRMSGTAKRYFEMFQRLIGEKNLAHVVLMTTMWGELNDQGVGLRRETQLRNEFWNYMESKGSHIRSFDGSRGMAQALVCRMMRKAPIVLRIQEEVVDEEKRLDETDAGKYILPRLEARMKESAGKLEDLENRLSKINTGNGEERNKLQKERIDLSHEQDQDKKRRDKMKKKLGKEIKDDLSKKTNSEKWKDRMSIFASVLGLAISATINLVLPLAGVAIC